METPSKVCSRIIYFCTFNRPLFLQLPNHSTKWSAGANQIFSLKHDGCIRPERTRDATFSKAICVYLCPIHSVSRAPYFYTSDWVRGRCIKHTRIRDNRFNLDIVHIAKTVTDNLFPGDTIARAPQLTACHVIASRHVEL